ncbi:MAG: potassium channel protein [Candidatus Dadabacteria bacterium]|nr:MAG: potassium channel protein [Candidatus Dadabacteria bacterium]
MSAGQSPLRDATVARLLRKLLLPRRGGAPVLPTVADLVAEVQTKLFRPTAAVASVFVMGTVGYHVLGQGRWSWLESAYMTSITLTTVGYGEILSGIDETTRLFTMMLMWTGMLVTLFAVSEVTAFMVEGTFRRLLREYRMARQIDAMTDHFIVCGAGRTGEPIVEELWTTQREQVVIERDPEHAEHVRRRFPEVPVIVGDATDEDVLEAAGIGHARGLVANVHDDGQNLLIVVQARYSRPDLLIVARSEEPHLNAKFERAGASYVVNPNRIGGLRMASQLLRPHTVSFLDRMLRGQDPSIRVDEVVVEEGSAIAGLTLEEAPIWEKAHLRVFALQRPDDIGFVYNPTGKERLDPGTIVIVIGNPQQLEALRGLTRHR